MHGNFLWFYQFLVFSYLLVKISDVSNSEALLIISKHGFTLIAT